jgi:hypothetical protein
MSCDVTHLVIYCEIGSNMKIFKVQVQILCTTKIIKFPLEPLIEIEKKKANI